VLIALSDPTDNERGAQYMEQVLDAVHRHRAMGVRELCLSIV
jgi:hypothetical protein